MVKHESQTRHRSVVLPVRSLTSSTEVANTEHPQWDDVASRCLSCTNCTLVCPTCFCDSGLDLNLGAHPPAAPQQLARREQQRLPALGTSGESEERLVIPLSQPIAASVLEISHPAGKLIDGRDLGMDHSTVPDRRADDRPPTLAQQVDQRLQAGNMQDQLPTLGHVRLRGDPPAADLLIGGTKVPFFKHYVSLGWRREMTDAR